MVTGTYLITPTQAPQSSSSPPAIVPLQWGNPSSVLTQHCIGQGEMSGAGDVINCTRVDHNTVECDGKDYHLEELLGATDVRFWVYLIMYLALVLFAGTVILLNLLAPLAV